jgi:hypothetical protein
VEYAPLLAPLLDIRMPEYRAPKLAAEELRREQLDTSIHPILWLGAG